MVNMAGPRKSFFCETGRWCRFPPVKKTMNPAPLKIGNLTVEWPVVLAPMAGYTDSAFRSLCLEHHCGLVLTELVTADGAARSHKLTLHYLETAPDERPVGAHIYGAEPETMAITAAKAEKMRRFSLVDINAGCPVRKIMTRGAGAGLLKNPERLFEVVRAVRQAVTLPVTVKTRIGVSEKQCNIMEVARGIEEAGANALFLHARLVSARHNGPADWETLAKVKAASRIPVIGNGGIETAKDALEMMRRTGVDGVMVGRASMGNPWIFDEIHALWTGTPYEPPTAKERARVMEDHLERLRELATKEKVFRRRQRWTAEEVACLRFRSQLVKYLAGREGLKSILRDTENFISIRDLMKAVRQLLQAAPQPDEGGIRRQEAEDASRVGRLG